MAMASLGEFERIARFFAPLAGPGGLGLTDDAAVLPGPAGSDLVLTADAIVEGVHFLPEDPPDLVARKLLRVNLSDLAAKGAEPLSYLLTTTLPARCGEDWLAGFSAGLAADQAEFGISLLGGDSVSTGGPIVLSLTAIGSVPTGAMIRRSGAEVGDLVFVSGTIGDGAFGLRALTGKLAGASPAALAFLADRYRLPRPRVSLGPRLRGLAHAMMDVSDGLVGDLGHICAASGVAAVIEAERVPLSDVMRDLAVLQPDVVSIVLTGGDDYELLFCAPAQNQALIERAAEASGVSLATIGRIEGGAGVRVVDGKGREIALETSGFRHF